MMMGCGPAGHQARHVVADDGLAEDDAAQDVADGAVGALPHLLEAELFDARLVGRDGRALDADAVLLDGVGGVDGDLIVGRVAVLDGEVVVLEGHVEVGMDELVLDQLPDDASHLVAVELDDGAGHLDLLHEKLPSAHGVGERAVARGTAVPASRVIALVPFDANKRLPCSNSRRAIPFRARARAAGLVRRSAFPLCPRDMQVLGHR